MCRRYENCFAGIILHTMSVWCHPTDVWIFWLVRIFHTLRVWNSHRIASSYLRYYHTVLSIHTFPISYLLIWFIQNYFFILVREVHTERVIHAMRSFIPYFLSYICIFHTVWYEIHTSMSETPHKKWKCMKSYKTSMKHEVLQTRYEVICLMYEIILLLCDFRHADVWRSWPVFFWCHRFEPASEFLSKLGLFWGSFLSEEGKTDLSATQIQRCSFYLAVFISRIRTVATTDIDRAE